MTTFRAISVSHTSHAGVQLGRRHGRIGSARAEAAHLAASGSPFAAVVCETDGKRTLVLGSIYPATAERIVRHLLSVEEACGETYDGIN